MIPRSLLLLSLLAVVSGSADDAQPTPRVRKTVSHGFVKPHARFSTHPIPSHHKQGLKQEDPFEVATEFIKTLLPTGEGAGEYTFKIRKDSYTDDRTGVSHVYAKQIFRGLPVSDGDVNVNVWKGRVISHGNEFFNPANHGLTRRSFQDQVPMEIPFPNNKPLIQDCNDAADRNCGSVDQLSRSLLNFLKTVHPSETVLTSLEDSFDSHLETVQVHAFNSLVEDDGHMDIGFYVHGLPGLAVENDQGVKAQLMYAQTPEGGLELAWKVIVELTDNVYEATLSAVDASAERVFSVVDWVSDSSLPIPMAPTKPKKPVEEAKEVDAIYQVFPWGVNDPTEGNRTIVVQSKVVDKIASPHGWHSIPIDNIPSGMILPDSVAPPKPKPKPGKSILVNFTTTVGNNVFAQENFEGRNSFLNNYRPTTWDAVDGTYNFTFEFAPVTRNDSESRMKEAQKHINATVTQLFYTTNAFHDLMYRYGFDEVSGNFQQYNFGRGGRENDGVIANAQDGSGFNNANFMTAPDGQNGRMRMYLWNTASPYRDGDMEAGIVIHELAHGLSTRLTGGPADSTCLAFGESGGMGEGWGDFLATTIRSEKNYKDYTMGSWAANDPKGIRNYPYSMNLTVNPETYKAVDKYFGVHPIGEVWAEMLWVVSQKLIAKHGFSDSLFPPAPNSPEEGDFYRTSSEGALVPKHGNTLIVQLVIDGMKLQPCRPGFLDARDAILQADEVLTNGENACEIWEGFAERGLGVDAKVVMRTPWGGGVRTDGFAVPKKCIN